LDKRAKKIERDLLAILLLYIAGQLNRDQTWLRGLRLIDEEFRLLVDEVNAYYKAQDLSGQLALESKKLRETRLRITAEFETLLDTEEKFWKTKKGIARGAFLLSLLVAYSVSSAITANVAREEGAVLVWHTQLDPQVCDYCASMEGLKFDPEGEIPDLPAHFGCRCWWSIVF